MSNAAVSGARAPRWRQWLLRLMPWHRRLAILACVGIFSWAGSGMLHPLMSFLQARPATMSPPQHALPLDELLSPAAVLGAAGIDKVQGLRLVQIEGEPYYQARLPSADEPRYWHARNGNDADVLARHAEALARRVADPAAGRRRGGAGVRQPEPWAMLCCQSAAIFSPSFTRVDTRSYWHALCIAQTHAERPVKI